MNRIILHSDLNNFYASVELLKHPELRSCPVAVGGNTRERRGIILAKNPLARSFGVKTGEAIWKSKEKCPDLIVLQPHFEEYARVSDQVRRIYLTYTDHVEPFGMDECWLDVTEIARDFDQGTTIAHEIRNQIRTELGVTVSIGVSFNKTFAKLGSDLKKPDAVTRIDPDNYRQIVWDLPVEQLLFVGRSTQKTLFRLGIYTIGDLARSDVSALERMLGKNGRPLWLAANGFDSSPVMLHGTETSVKSLGNSVTTPRDLTCENDIQIVLYSLCDTVSTRLRKLDYVCNTLQISIKNNDFSYMERQVQLPYPGRSSHLLFQSAVKLLEANHSCYADKPIRALGVRTCNLEPNHQVQLRLLSEYHSMQKHENLESATDQIRTRFGKHALRRGIMLTDSTLSDAAKDTHGAFELL